MNGSHPIDDLFRTRLGELEAEPPPGIWAAVAAHQGKGAMRPWYQRKRVGLAAFLLFFLGGGVWWLTTPRPTGPVRNIAHTVIENRSTAIQELPVPTAPTAQPKEPAFQNELGERPTAQPVPERTTAHAIRLSSSQPPLPASDPYAFAQSLQAHTDQLQAPLPMNVHTSPLMGTLAMDSSAVAISIPTRSWGRQMPDHLSTPWSHGAMEGQHMTRSAWWFALQGGVARLDGSWQGPGSEALNAAEKYQQGSELGLRFGRRWMNGFSVGSGLGMVQQDSRFLYQQTGTPTTQGSVDTTWSGTAMGVLTIYTWQLDTLFAEVPGTDQRWSATNRYTSLRVPLELGWRKDDGRMQFGTRGGLLLDVPMARQGNTLAFTGTEGVSEVVPLNDVRFDERFRPSLSAFAALELGYLVSHRWLVLCGPQATWQLGSPDAGAPRPRVNELGAWGRVEYLLSKRIIPASLP